MSDPTERWWEPRRFNEPTATYLARVLDKLGADDLARNARDYHYDDFRCPDHLDITDNIHRLVAEVEEWAVAHQHPRRARVVMAAARDGEFDATKAESRAWAASTEGRQTFWALLRDPRRGR